MTDSSASVLPALTHIATLSICFSEYLFDFKWISALTGLVSIDLSLCARLEDEHLMYVVCCAHHKDLLPPSQLPLEFSQVFFASRM